MSQPERRAVPVLSVMDIVLVSAGCSRTDTLTDMIALARTADAVGYERYWLAEHHGSTTYLSSATTILMGQVLAVTERLEVASGGIVLPNHTPLVVAEQVGTLVTLYPGRVDLGLGRTPGIDRRTTAALRRRASEPGRFAEEILEILTCLGGESVPERVPGSLLLGSPGSLNDALHAPEPGGPRMRAIPGEGTRPTMWMLSSSVNGARVAGRLELPFAAASHFALARTEAVIAAYRSVLKFRTDDAPGLQGAPNVPRVAAAVNVMMALSQEEARLLFSTAMATAAHIVGNRPRSLNPPSQDSQAWRACAPGREGVVETAMSLSLVGTADDVATRLREQAARWDLDEILVVTYAHDPALRRRSYELLTRAWNA